MLVIGYQIECRLGGGGNRMIQYILSAVLIIVVLSMAAFTLLTWIFWREDRRENILGRIAEYMRDVANRCDQLASACSDKQTKGGLESLSLDLTKKAAELQPDFVAGVALSTKRASPVQWSRWPVNLEASLMLVAESTVVLLAIEYWFKPEPICVALAYFVPVVFIATRYGFVPAITGLVASTLLAAFLFFPPRFNLSVADPRQLVELLVFSGIGFVAIQIIAKHKKHSMGPLPG